MDERERNDRQKVRREANLKLQAAQLAVDAGKTALGSVEFRRVSDKTALDLLSLPREEQKKIFFTPYPAYAEKVAKIRPPWKGEVGVVEKPGQPVTYLLLEDPTPDPFQVTATVEQRPRRAFVIESDPPSVCYAFDEADAAQTMGVDGRMVRRAPQFDRCSEHELVRQMETTEEGTQLVFLQCKTCGAQ